MLMLVYSGGFVAVFLIFTLLHWNALRRRRQLDLDPLQAYDAGAGARMHSLSVAVGVTSILLAALLPIQYLAYSGLILFLMGPLHAAHGHFNGRRRGRLAATR